MLIQNYGLFWRRSRIAEGKWPRSGKLLGIGKHKKRQGKVDFADQRGIYALYDDTFRLIYVGQAGRGTNRLYNRLRSHSHLDLAERWTRFSWFGILPLVEGRTELDDSYQPKTPDIIHILNHIEAVLIMAAEPIRNNKGGIFGDGVTHYRQWRPEEDKEPYDSVDEDEE